MANHVCGTVDASTASCLDFDKTCGGSSMDLSPPAPVVGACPVYRTATVPEAGWGARARLCAVGEPASGVCDAGEICTPPVGAPFELAYCITTSQLANCPAGPYSHPRVYYGGAADDRACSPCLCGPSSVTCAGGTVTTFMGMNCGLGPIPMPSIASQSCTNVGGAQSALYNNDAVVTPGVCAPSGGLATGSFTAMTPTTICCTQ
jgi:hypothetical protein